MRKNKCRSTSKGAMDKEHVERASLLLLKARTMSSLITTFPESCIPRNLREAYQIQDRLVELLAKETKGWFLGCTNPEIQNQLGLPHPYFARLLSGSVLFDSETIDISPPLSGVVELEFTFRLGKSIPPRDFPYEESEILEAVSTVHPSIEVFISHFNDFMHQNIFNLVADNGTDGFLLVGEGTICPHPELLRYTAVSLKVNGQIVRSGKGAKIMGGEGPLSALTWLANQPHRYPGIREGHIISTGTCTTMYYAKCGDQLEAEFGELGNMAVRLCASERAPRVATR